MEGSGPFHAVADRNCNVRSPNRKLHHRNTITRTRVGKPRQAKCLPQPVPHQCLLKLVEKFGFEIVGPAVAGASSHEREFVGVQLAVNVTPSLGYEAGLEDRVERGGKPGRGDVLVFDELLAGLESEVTMRECEAKLMVHGVLLKDGSDCSKGFVGDRILLDFGEGHRVHWELVENYLMGDVEQHYLEATC